MSPAGPRYLPSAQTQRPAGPTPQGRARPPYTNRAPQPQVRESRAQPPKLRRVDVLIHFLQTCDEKLVSTRCPALGILEALGRILRGRSHTVSEINGDFSRKSQIHPPPPILRPCSRGSLGVGYQRLGSKTRMMGLASRKEV